MFVSFSEKILTSYASYFTLDTATKGADVVFILGGNPKTRPAKAIELVKNGYSKQILMTNIKDKALKYQELFETEEELTSRILKSENETLKIIKCIKEDGATSTFDEAYTLAKYSKENKLTHLIIVTDAFHTRRALYAFEKVFKIQGMKNIKLEIAPARNGVYLENNWWKTEKGLRSYIIEPIKYFFYMFNSRNLKSLKS
ncbi:MAG: YdcF family protein [Candidatus Marinarcus sp.]|uniref:YdcF family protein n=1 Tax=Candidatus Marinarcus sp. TaxID=3100987 RepID=UPI003B00D5A2